MRKKKSWTDSDTHEAIGIIVAYEKTPWPGAWGITPLVIQRAGFQVIAMSEKMSHCDIWGMDQTGQLTLPYLGQAGAHFRKYIDSSSEVQTNQFFFDHQQLRIQFPGEPNNSERHLNDLLVVEGLWSKFPWTGNVISIGGQYKPDNPNHSGKAVIEMFGDYFHSKGEDLERIALFEKYGYRTLVVWEHTLTDGERVRRALRDFACGKIKSGIIE